MKISMDVETLNDVQLTDFEKEMCDANITQVEMSGSVTSNFETFKVSLGGDVPNGVNWLKFAKYLYSQINWLRQGIRKNMQEGGHLGNSLKGVDQR